MSTTVLNSDVAIRILLRRGLHYCSRNVCNFEDFLVRSESIIKEFVNKECSDRITYMYIFVISMTYFKDEICV